MSHFYGTVRGNRGETTRMGTKDSGVTTWAASWKGAIRARCYIRDGKDWADVQHQPWYGRGANVPLYNGPLSDDPREVMAHALRTLAHQLSDKHRQTLETIAQEIEAPEPNQGCSTIRDEARRIVDRLDLVAAQTIRTYDSPQWLVEPQGEPSEQDDLDAIMDAGFEILDNRVMGWGAYDTIIRVKDGPDYLVQFA